MKTIPSYNADILVVDDTRDNLRLLSKLLIEHDYYVRPVSDGKRAISAIRDQLPDLILLDIMMPGMDGYEVCEVLKADKRTSDIPIIFISALNEIVDKVKAFSSGGVDFITKPFQEEEVLARVKTHLDLRNMQMQLQTQNVRLQHEITERKKTEDALREANAGKDIFFSIIAHDLRSPFNALLGYSEIALQRLNEISRDEIRHYINQIKACTESVYALLENLLTWSRLQRGAMEYHPEDFPLSGMVTHIVQIFNSTANQKQITICNRIPGEFSVHADQNMIHTVFRNLISNALKFTDSGGNIEITANSDVESETVEIQVTDTGIGIPGDALSKLFKIETKITTTGTAGEQGTGLGLSLCNDLVEKNGGTLEVESVVGEGSVFRFSLSCSEQGRTALSKPESELIQPGQTGTEGTDSLKISIGELPDSWQTELRNAARILDIDRIEDLIERIRGQHGQLAEKLADLVVNYKFDTLQKISERINKNT